MNRRVILSILILIFTIMLFQSAFAAQIRLAWNANTESDLAGYKVYYGNSSRSYANSIDVGDQTTFALTGLIQGQTYFIVVTAYDTSSYESGYSNEVSGVASQITPSPGGTPPTITPSCTTIDCPGKVYITTYDQNQPRVPIGNVKQYEVSSNNNTRAAGAETATQTPQVIDSNKTPALDANYQIKDASQSSWSSQPDGNRVDSGGIGGVLASRTESRNIYTYLGDQNLTAESNAFAIKNERITPELLGLVPEDQVGREKLIESVHGYDSNITEKGNLTFVKRKWILGAVVNSRPLVIPYGKSKSVIFVGANDGMLHAFDNTTGEEFWGFIPKELLGRLNELTQDNQLKFYVDGSPKAYITESQKIMVFGLRKGGNYYYGLDVTDPVNPKFLWKIGPGTTGYSELAQTWSTPQIGKVKYGKGERAVFFIGGGYDKNQNRKNQTARGQKGRAVYAVDVLTGIQVWRWDYQKDPNMKYSIPSDVARVDTNGDGYIDRLYVGDIGGRLWRFDTSDLDPNNWSGKIIFDSNAGTTAGERKIFNPPDVTLEKDYAMVLFGTGDREHQDETKVSNRIYAFRDKGSNSILSEGDLANLTKDIASLENIEHKEGWFISLEADRGEKVLAPPVVVYGVAYFTTYTPSPSGSDGVARIYALDHKTGYPAFNFSKGNDTRGPNIDLSDRSKIIGKGIASGTIISAVKGKLIAFTGIEGGIYTPPLKKHSTIIPIWWREINK